MKRTGFKIKPRKPMKRGKLKKKSKQKISTIQKKLWELCKQITRKKYGNTCYTCLTPGLQGSNWHTGHLFAKASLGAYLKYDLRVLRPQCYHCNINLGGRGADYYTRMLKEIGQEEMEKLQKDRQITINAMEHYLRLIVEYEGILNEMNENLTTGRIRALNTI